MKSVSKDSTGYLNNTSNKKNKLLGHFSGEVGYHNNDRRSESNLWIKGEVDSNGFFTLTSVPAKKNLRATSKTDFDLIEQGFDLIEQGMMLVHCKPKSCTAYSFSL